MNPPPPAIASIQAKVVALGGWSLGDDAAVFAALRAATVPNPITVAPTVAKPFQTSDFVTTVGPANLLKIVSLPAFDATLRPLVDSPDPKSADVLRQLNQWAAGAAKIGYLTTGAGSEYDALAAPVAPGTTPGATGLFNETHSDPTWTATVPWDLATLGRAVDLDDVTKSRPE